MIRGRSVAGAVIAALALTLALTPAASAAAPKGFFGVMPQGPLTDEDFSLMGDANLGTLRFEIPWPAVDPSSAPDDYDWSSVDATVTGAARNGVALLPFVTSAPAWVLKLDGHDCEPNECPSYGPKGKRALAAWGRFFTAAVARYGPKGEFWELNPNLPERPIRDWQIYNEMNSPSFWKPKPNVKAYARLLDTAHDAIKREDRGAKVILGGMFGTPLGGVRPAIAAWDFLAKLYRQPGAKRNFDGVAPHPYASKLVERPRADRAVSRRDQGGGRSRRRALDHGARLGVGWTAEPAQPRSRRPGRPPHRGVPVLAEEAAQAQPGTGDMVLVAGQLGHRSGALRVVPEVGPAERGSLAQASFDAFTRFTDGA